MNLQETEFDARAEVRSFSESDLFMKYLMESLKREGRREGEGQEDVGESQDRPSHTQTDRKRRRKNEKEQIVQLDNPKKHADTTHQADSDQRPRPQSNDFALPDAIAHRTRKRRQVGVTQRS